MWGVLHLCRPHPLSVSVLCLPLLTAHTWSASGHQLPFKYTWFPCSRRQIVLRYIVVVIRTWLQYILLSSSSLVDISCPTFFLFVYKENNLQPACFYTSSPPAALPLGPGGPGHVDSAGQIITCMAKLSPTIRYDVFLFISYNLLVQFDISFEIKI